MCCGTAILAVTRHGRDARATDRSFVFNNVVAFIFMHGLCTAILAVTRHGRDARASRAGRPC